MLPTDGTGFGLLPTVQTQGLKVCDSDGKTQFMDLSLLPTPRATKLTGTDREDFSPSLPGLIGKGLLPTPKAQNANAPGGHGQGGLDLQTFVQQKLLPTPMAQDGDNSMLPRSQLDRSSLPGFVMRMLPTPQAADGFKSVANQNQDTLHKTFQTGGNSQLNPRFVGEMMGFPVDWLELPFRATEETV